MNNSFIKRFLLSVVLISVSFINLEYLNSQSNTNSEKEETKKYSNVIGIRYSNFSGYGPYYERYFLEHYSVKLTGLLYYYEYVKGEDPDIIQDEKNIFYTAGIQFKRDLFKINNFSAYALIGGSYLNDHDKEENIEFEFENQDTKTTKWIAGIGIGVSVTIKTRFILELEAGYKLINKITTVGDDPVEFNSANNFNKSQFGIGLGAGFIF